MKVLDSMTGIKVSSGCPTVHFALLIAVCCMPFDQECGSLKYYKSINLMAFSHAVNALRIVVTTSS